MLSCLDPLRDLTSLSILVRMLLSVVCGGLIGIEREHKRRPAGFRTHILICLGAAMTTLTGQYLLLTMHEYTDVARLGAQVIAGVGFIGAGTIIVTRRRRVKGLTTAAGLWAAAIIGLTCGAGYYEAAVYATALILIAELFFSRLEYRIMASARDLTLYVEYADSSALDHVIHHLRSEDITVVDLEVTRASDTDRFSACAILTLELNRKRQYEKLMNDLTLIDGVSAVEEL